MSECTTSWTSKEGAGALWRYQESVPVELIATPREAFRSCTQDQRLADVVERNRAEVFDHLPVTTADGRIIGVLEAFRWFDQQAPAGSVEDYKRDLREDLMIGADASILEFVRNAADHPFRFVVAGTRISGLVSLSDLQQIAVRTALFALVTHLEMAMIEVIRHRMTEANWMRRLNRQQRAAVNSKIERGRQANTLVEPLVYTSLGDKIRILTPEFAASDSPTNQFDEEFEAIRQLRNSLAHATDYASTRDEARTVCACVRRIGEWIEVFELACEERSV